MNRLSDWEQRLSDYISSVWDKPFAWGTHDCCTNYFDAVEAMSGEDIWSEMRGGYSTSIGSQRVLRRHGYANIQEAIGARCRAVPSAFLQRGDAVWNGDSVGICMGGFALFLNDPEGPGGMVKVPRSSWQGGWSPWDS